MNEYEVASELFLKLMRHVKQSVERDRSKIKLNVFEKGLVIGLTSDRNVNGTLKYINGMYPEDMRELVKDLALTMSKLEKRQIPVY